jgi:hypothetical protein
MVYTVGMFCPLIAGIEVLKIPASAVLRRLASGFYGCPGALLF